MAIMPQPNIIVDLKMTESQQYDNVKINSTSYEALVSGGGAKHPSDSPELNVEDCYNKEVTNSNLKQQVTDGGASDLCLEH